MGSSIHDRFKRKLDGTVVPREQPRKARPRAPRTPGSTSGVKNLDALCWTLCSEYIRRRDANEYGMVRCVTCPTSKPMKHWKELHAGHFQRRGKMSTKYLLENLHPQCVYCNHYKDGQEYEHARYIDKRYGPGTAEKIRNLAQEERKFTQNEYLAMIQYFKGLIAQLPDHPTPMK